jgi:putative membrane protein
MLFWQWRGIVLSISLATVVTIAYQVGGQKWLSLPTLPLVVVGAALGIFVSFRTNSAYDRWWEGRKLWGALVNTSRHFAIEAIHYLPEDLRDETQALVRRQIAYVHTLRCLLRVQDPLADDDLAPYLTDDEKTLTDTSNLTNRLLDNQMTALETLSREGKVDAFRLQSFDASLRSLLDIQGGCERIKKTPLPRPYSFMSETMIRWFGALMPCGLVAQLGWGAIPVSAFVVLGFKLISETGRVLEDPFSTFWNGLPLSALSRTIEINLLELLGDKDLPEPWAEDPPGILM